MPYQHLYFLLAGVLMTEQQHIDRTLKAMSRNGWEFSYCHSGNLYFPSAIEASYTNHEAGKLLRLDMPESISWLFDPQAEHDPYGVFPEYKKVPKDTDPWSNDGRKEIAVRYGIKIEIAVETKPRDRFRVFCEMLDKYGVEIGGYK